MNRTMLCGLALLALFASGVSASTPDAVIAQLWKAMSNEPGGQADIDTLRRIIHPEAVVFGGRHGDSQPLRRWTAEQFLEPFGRVGEKGFHECEIHRVVHAHGRFATAYSVVESRADRTAAAPDFTGVNSIQLYRYGDRWTVLSLYYYVEDAALPIQSPGTSGTCLD